MNDKQRDPRLNEILYPLYDEKRATEIIKTYEQDETAIQENRLTKDGLIRFVIIIVITIIVSTTTTMMIDQVSARKVVMSELK